MESVEKPMEKALMMKTRRKIGRRAASWLSAQVKWGS